MTKLAFLLHLYQPVTQDEKTFKGIAESSYLPLIKLIKNKKLNVTLNIPLSLLEQMDKYRYSSWIEDVKSLVDQEIITITGSAAYHCLLPKMPEEIIQKQVVLNEYGNGFYLGRKTGFEGEQAILVRDFNGFFPPEAAINSNVHDILDSLGYRWVLVNETSTGNNPGVYKLEDKDCLLVSKNVKLSDTLAFVRNTDANELIEIFAKAEDSVVALDGETFGHHNADGIFMLSKLIDKLQERGVQFVTVNDFVEDAEAESKIKTLNDLVESTWAPKAGEDPYKLWEGNKIQDLQWELVEKTIKAASAIEKKSYEEMENVSLWEGDLPEDIEMEILFLKLLQSDQFWWVSGVTIGDSVLFNETMLDRSLELYSKFADLLGDQKYAKLVAEYTEKIKKEFEKHETDNATTLLPTT